MPSLEEFQSVVADLAAGACPADRPETANVVHQEEHPTRQACAATIVEHLFSIEITVRAIAWSPTVRPAVGTLLFEIRQQIGRLEQEHGLMPTPYWTRDQIIAGGPGYERRWPGYSR